LDDCAVLEIRARAGVVLRLGGEPTDGARGQDVAGAEELPRRCRWTRRSHPNRNNAAGPDAVRPGCFVQARAVHRRFWPTPLDNVVN
jgi:hypothetical protein